MSTFKWLSYDMVMTMRRNDLSAELKKRYVDLRGILNRKKTTNPNSNTVEKTAGGSYLEGKLIESVNDFYRQEGSKFDLSLYDTFLEALDPKKYNTHDIEGDILRLCETTKFYQGVHKDVNNLGVTGLFVSAAINKAADGRNEINLRLTVPLNHLLYRSSDKKVNVYGKAGSTLGQCSENCKITAEEVGNYAGWRMSGGTLDVKKAGNYLGSFANECEITAYEAEVRTGWRMKGVILTVRKTGSYLGYFAENCNITAEDAGDYAGNCMEGGTLIVKKAGEHFGELSHNTTVILDGRKKGLLWKILNQF